MTVQELREAITQKTEEINGYLESRVARSRGGVTKN